MLDIIPTMVFGEVQAHLRERSREAQSGWESASDEEDALTGDFCGSLRTEWREARAADERWRWKVQYKKFRGRGEGALGKHIGADGVVQIAVHTPGGVVVSKGVLFQAKKVRGSSRSDLREQVEKMEGLAPGGSAVFEFGPDGYHAASGSAIISEMNARPARIPHPRNPIGEYLADQFLPCASGLRGMYYDAVRQNLIVPVDGAIRIVPVSLRYRLRVDIVHESQVSNVEERYE